MLTPALKHTLKVIFVFIVIAGLIASYLFTGVSQPAPQPTSDEIEQPFNFVDPSSNPSVGTPAEAPSVNGPTSPPPAAQ